MRREEEGFSLDAGLDVGRGPAEPVGPPEPFVGSGPFLGVFYGPPLPGRPRFGNAGSLFRLLSRLAPHVGLSVYVFSPEDLEALPGRITGRFHDGREWLRRSFPLPQVIYDRALADEPSAEDVLAAGRGLIPPGIPLINSRRLADGAGDKWAVHLSLLDHPGLAPHLLETQLLAGGGKHVVETCLEHGAVILKNRTGRRALGVMRVALEPGGRFAVSWNPAAGGAWRIPGVKRAAATIRSLAPDQCARLVDRLLGGREVIVQRAVTAPEEAQTRRGMGSEGGAATGPDAAGTDAAAGRDPGRRAAVEVRVIMHRTPPQGVGPDPPGRWLRTGMVCRMARAGLPFLVLGQELDERPSAALPAALGSAALAAQVLSVIRRLARLVACHMEKRFGPGAELAVDFLVDGSGRPWFLEVNTVPATLFRRTGAERLRRRAAQRVLRYAAFLAASGRADVQAAAPG